MLRNVQVDLSPALAGKRVRAAELYSPWNGGRAPGKVKNGKIRLPAFMRSVVVRVTATDR